MSEADDAVANAIKFECKKDGLQQRQSGDWMLRVVFKQEEYSEYLGRAPMGTRFQAVLVEIDSDETPVDHKAQDRDKWRALGPVKQAGIRCNDPIFWAWLTEERGWHVTNAELAAVAVRELCNVASRSDLGKPAFGEQRIAWYMLDAAFQGWKAREHA
jgi:hypothetical protein